MKVYTMLSYYDMDKGISSYSCFIQTTHGIVCENIDIHESELEEYTQENDLECIKIYLKKKYKVSISLTFIKAHYDVIW